MTYEQALATIHGLEGRSWRRGLERMRAFVHAAGLSTALTGRNYIHIAGTNGKGTTAAFTESILRSQGWRTGAFFSPFVVNYRERIQAMGQMIEEAEFVKLVQRLLPVVDSVSTTEFGGVTKFEIEAALGFAYWQEKACDWVALETGLGGRLDATNVVTPRACVITSIGLDHTGILGKSLAEIAAEKAGIIKPEVPVIVGPLPNEAAAVVRKIARTRAAPLWSLGREIEVVLEPSGRSVTVRTPLGDFEGLEAPPLGLYAAQNMALALAACVSAGAVPRPDAVARNVAETWLPGRFEIRKVNGREVVFDGAHNADASEALRSLLDLTTPGPIRLVTNMVSGHEVNGFYESLRGKAVSAEVAPIAFARALEVPEAVAQIRSCGIPAHGHASIGEALSAALAYDDALVVVTGSNYLVGDALRLSE